MLSAAANNIPQEESLEQLRRYVEDQINSAIRPGFSVVLTGQVGSGKSTLINSFLGDEVIPTSSQATSRTAVPIQCMYEDRDGYRAIISYLAVSDLVELVATRLSDSAHEDESSRSIRTRQDAYNFVSLLCTAESVQNIQQLYEQIMAEGRVPFTTAEEQEALRSLMILRPEVNAILSESQTHETFTDRETLYSYLIPRTSHGKKSCRNKSEFNDAALRVALTARLTLSGRFRIPVGLRLIDLPGSADINSSFWRRRYSDETNFILHIWKNDRGMTLFESEGSGVLRKLLHPGDMPIGVNDRSAVVFTKSLANVGDWDETDRLEYDLKEDEEPAYRAAGRQKLKHSVREALYASLTEDQQARNAISPELLESIREYPVFTVDAKEYLKAAKTGNQFLLNDSEVDDLKRCLLEAFLRRSSISPLVEKKKIIMSMLRQICDEAARAAAQHELQAQLDRCINVVHSVVDQFLGSPAFANFRLLGTGSSHSPAARDLMFLMSSETSLLNTVHHSVQIAILRRGGSYYDGLTLNENIAGAIRLHRFWTAFHQALEEAQHLLAHELEGIPFTPRLTIEIRRYAGTLTSQLETEWRRTIGRVMPGLCAQALANNTGRGSSERKTNHIARGIKDSFASCQESVSVRMNNDTWGSFQWFEERVRSILSELFPCLFISNRSV